MARKSCQYLNKNQVFLFEINPLFRLYWPKLITNISSFDYQKRLVNPLGWTHASPGGSCTGVRKSVP